MPKRAKGIRGRVSRRRRQVRRLYGGATRGFRLLPSFIIVGAQRGGTTSFFRWLCRHPQIARPADKELHYFDHQFWRGVDWYRSFFPTREAERLARLRGRKLLGGEATPYYLFHPAVPARVAATVPDVRLIALLRNPVDRAYSHYRSSRSMNVERLSFEEALDAEEERLAGAHERLLADPRRRSFQHFHHSYVARGLYADQLERWLAHFPPESLLVIRSEDYFARPAEAYAEAVAFFGLDPSSPPDLRWERRSDHDPLDASLRARLEERFAEPNARLARLLGREPLWEIAAARTGADRVGSALS